MCDKINFKYYMWFLLICQHIILFLCPKIVAKLILKSVKRLKWDKRTNNDRELKIKKICKNIISKNCLILSNFQGDITVLAWHFWARM